MKLPSLLRRTPFRLTLLFLALFAAAASAILAWVYFASAEAARTKAERDVGGEMQVLTGIYDARGLDALNMAVIDRTLTGRYEYLLMDRTGARITGSLSISPFETFEGNRQWITFPLTDTLPDGTVVRPQARGVQVRLAGGEMLFVGASLIDTEAYLARLTQALWAAMGIVLLLGLAGGILVSRNLERAMGRLGKVVTAVQEGDLKARAVVKNSGD